MRYSPLLPTRRPSFGRRIAGVDEAPAGPTREERRLLDRIVSHMGKHRER